jgi:hypothetical protein
MMRRRGKSSWYPYQLQRLAHHTHTHTHTHTALCIASPSGVAITSSFTHLIDKENWDSRDRTKVEFNSILFDLTHHGVEEPLVYD